MQQKTDNFYNRETSKNPNVEKASKTNFDSKTDFELNESPIFSSSEDQESDESIESGDGQKIHGKSCCFIIEESFCFLMKTSHLFSQNICCKSGCFIIEDFLDFLMQANHFFFSKDSW